MDEKFKNRAKAIAGGLVGCVAACYLNDTHVEPMLKFATDTTLVCSYLAMVTGVYATMQILCENIAIAKKPQNINN